jgi:hypothetical protein
VIEVGLFGQINSEAANRKYVGTIGGLAQITDFIPASAKFSFRMEVGVLLVE